MYFIDTHTHLHVKRFNRNRQEILEWMDENDMYNIEIPITYESNEFMREKLADFSNVRFAVGVHPTRVKKITAKTAKKYLEELAARQDTVAVGETGLDFHLPTLDTLFVEQMEDWFLYFLDLAENMHLPVILHTRQADERILELLRQQKRQFQGVVHCFQGDLDLAKRYMELGFYLGIGGAVTYVDQCEALRRAIVEIPIERIVLETDCPYLTPNLLEGYNRPQNLLFIADELAKLKNLDPQIIEMENVKNARNIFHL